MNIKKSIDDILGYEMYKTQLSCGMDSYFLPLKPEINVKIAHIYTRFGSIDAKFYNPELDKVVEVEDGTAHFLEHCAFYDPEGNDALIWFGDKGVSSNAWTSFDHTTFYFHSAGRQKFARYLDFLINFVTTPYLEDEVVNKEKKVIDQEIARSLDDPSRKLFQNLMKGLLQEHPLRRSILGDQETIRRITPEYLKAAYTTFYHPSNLNLVMMMPSKDPKVDARKYMELAEKITSEKGFSKKGRPEYIYADEPEKVLVDKVYGIGNVSKPMAYLGFKGDFDIAKDPKEKIKQKIANELLMEMLTTSGSDKVYELVQKNVVIGNSFGGFSFSGRGFNLMILGASTEDAERFESGVIDMVRSSIRDGLSKDLFEIVKRSSISDRAKIFEMGSIQSFEHTIVKELASLLDPMDYMKTLMDIRFEDVAESGRRYLDTDNYTLSVIMPK